jgi:predicted RNase H-like HicB family nuclease
VTPWPRNGHSTICDIIRLVNLKIILEPSDDGGFTAYVPTLPGCISEGDTRDEALANIREAIELYLEPVEDDLAGKEGAEIAELTV